MKKRLQKILAEMGVASRRKAEELILEGRVTVNGTPATIGMKADPMVDHIKLDGRLLGKAEPKVYLLFNKPKSVVTSLYDPEGRPTVKDYLRGVKYRVYPVGRLDFDSEGLLLLTNDGEFAHRVLHPSKKVPKTYVVKAKGIIEDADIEKLRRGVRLEDGRTAPARVRKMKRLKENSWIEITLHEGRKRQIRRMLEKVGHVVIRLKRVRIDGIELGELKPGEFRHLSSDEVKQIEYWSEGSPASRVPAARGAHPENKRGPRPQKGPAAPGKGIRT
jgi:23S rRNA pseudouridine2605 synthase